MPQFEPVSAEQEQALTALQRQNAARRRSFLAAVTAHATIDFVATLRPALMDQGYEAEQLLADWIEVEAEAMRRHATARGIFRWATRRTRRTLNFLGRKP
jgi:hypothetical protein